MSRGLGNLGDVRWGAIAQNQTWPIPTQPGHSQPVRTCDVPKQASSWQSTNKGVKDHEAGRLAWRLASYRGIEPSVDMGAKTRYPRV